jgi:5-methylthioadenosine/S-adenosylhomocysteine deaminase
MADPWVCLYFAPHDAAEVSDETLIRVRRVADELDARVAMESPPLARLHDLGLLRPGFTAVGLNNRDSSLIATTGISVVACVQSHLRLGGGAAPIAQLVLSSMAKQGVTIGLGTGDPPSVGALDLLAEGRVAALIDNGLTAEDTLRMATLGGATALGLGTVTGSIEPGKYADLVCFDLNRLSCQPTLRVPESILFGATREQASDVWTSGRAAVAGGHLLAFDEQELSTFAQKWSQRVGTGDKS